MANQVQTEQGIVRILDDSVLDGYNESIKSYNSERAREYLGKFSRSNGELTGSSPLMIIQLINAGLLPKETRLATREDLEYAVSRNNSFLRENYTDFGLALRSAGDSYQNNDLLAKRLASQLEQRDINIGEGKLIPLDVLSLIDEKDLEYGVVIDLKEEAEKSIRDINDFKWNYARNEGLSRADLYGYRGWDSLDVHLAGSYGGGRVVVVSDEGTTKNFQPDNLMQKIQSALNRRKAFEYQGTLYVPVSDTRIKINK